MVKGSWIKIKRIFGMKVIVNNIRSAHNVGSIFRSADAIGVEEVILTGYTPTPIDRFGLPNKPVLKVSLGSENSVKWKTYKRIGSAIEYCRKQNKKIFALEITKNAVSYTDKVLDKYNFEDVVLILGNEKTGVSAATLKKVDEVIFIPMNGMKESLNVSIAFAVAAFGLRDKRI
jgi:23S rRNA (guanosine2251-2'-O)-methyltransferase